MLLPQLTNNEKTQGNALNRFHLAFFLFVVLRLVGYRVRNSSAPPFRYCFFFFPSQSADGFRPRFVGHRARGFPLVLAFFLAITGARPCTLVFFAFLRFFACFGSRSDCFPAFALIAAFRPFFPFCFVRSVLFRLAFALFVF